MALPTSMTCNSSTVVPPVPVPIPIPTVYIPMEHYKEVTSCQLNASIGAVPMIGSA